MTNTVPRFISTLQTWVAAVSTVNTNFDGSGSFDTILTAPVEGSKVDYITFLGQVSTPVNALTIFLSTSADTNYYWRRMTVSATTPDPDLDDDGWSGTLTPVEPLFIPGGWKLKMALFTATTINVFVQGGDF